MSFDFIQWKNQRATTKAGGIYKQYAALVAFYEFHKRIDEPWPAAVMEAEHDDLCDSLGRKSSFCGKPAHYEIKTVHLTRGGAPRFRADKRCYACLQKQVMRRLTAKRWIPKVLAEVCEHLMGADWRTVCYRKFYPLKPLKKRKPTKEEARRRIAEVLGINRSAA